MEAIEMDVEWSPIFPFHDTSDSFVHGFEAGKIWTLMEAGQKEINLTVHRENKTVIARMADTMGYRLSFNEVQAIEWIDCFLEKNTPIKRNVGLTLVK